MNDVPRFAFFAVVIIVFAAFAIAAQVRFRNELARTYRRLAERFQGHCHVDGLWQQPSVNFTYKNAYALLDILSTGGEDASYYTQLRISWPDLRLRCEVYPAGVLAQIRKFFGMEDVEIGSPRFDQDYVIKGSCVDELRGFLTPAVQQVIEELRRFGDSARSFRLDGSKENARSGDIYISVARGQLLIKKQGLIREYEPLEAFVLLALELFNRATHASAEGIHFVGAKSDAKLSLKDAVCQVCGERVTLDAVFCRSCKTPHHKDCWEYYGACSTYGCGQRRYLVQRRRGTTTKGAKYTKEFP